MEQTEQPKLEVVPTPACADCGQEFPHLHRHHITPKAEGGSDDESNIVRLCPNCHALRHGGSFGRNVQRRRRTGTTGKVQGRKVSFKPAHDTYISIVAEGKGLSFDDVLSELLDGLIWGKEARTAEDKMALARSEAVLAELRRLMEPVYTLLDVTDTDTTANERHECCEWVPIPKDITAQLHAISTATGHSVESYVRLAIRDFLNYSGKAS